MSTTYPTPDPTIWRTSRLITTTPTSSSCIVLSGSLASHPASTATSASFACGGYGGGEPQITEKPISDPIPSPSATNTLIDESPNQSSTSNSGANTVGNLAVIISSIGLVVFGIGCLRLRQMRQQQRRIRESSDQLRDPTHLPSSFSSSSPHNHFLLPLSMSMSIQQPSSSLLPPPPLSPVPSHLLLYSQPRSTPQQHIEMLARLQDQYPDNISPPPPYQAPPPRSHPRR